MPQSAEKQLTWDKKGVERMEFFMAEQIAFYITEQVLPDWSGCEGKLIDELRCVQGAPTHPEFLSMSIPVAGNVMGNMMAQELMKLLLSPDTISGIVYDAIARAIKDEEYDRLHSDYDMP